ncbi:MAG: AAA family ATPase [Chloroflexota bacterium]
MRIREIVFRDFRSFRGEKRISFVDPLTDTVRPMTVIAGTNGSGKTTILDSIEALLKLVMGSEEKLIHEAMQSGLIWLELELFAPDRLHTANAIPSESQHILAGRGDLVSAKLRENGLTMVLARYSGSVNVPLVTPFLVEELYDAVTKMYEDESKLYGGLLYLPYDRQMGVAKGGPIQQPPPPKGPASLWITRLSPSDYWEGGLEQFWVWQNYLDLERGERRANLGRFVSTVERILGEGRPITVRDGRVTVPVAWKQNGNTHLVRLDQLPSGEQQVLLLFGELARRRRPGAVIAIDEPEKSLHPSLQRLVVHQLRRIAQEWDAQVILATHSLEILRSVHESEIIFLDQLAEPEAERVAS